MFWILLFVLYFVVCVLVGNAVERGMVRRLREAMAHCRWEPVAPGSGHARTAPVVAALEAEGYVVDSHAVLDRRPHASHAVALVHPDGSLALVTSIGRPWASPTPISPSRRSWSRVWSASRPRRSPACPSPTAPWCRWPPVVWDIRRRQREDASAQGPPAAV